MKKTERDLQQKNRLPKPTGEYAVGTFTFTVRDDRKEGMRQGGILAMLKLTKAKGSDEELARFSIARKYQLAQQCLYLAAAKEQEALELVRRLGPEYEAWFLYMAERRKSFGV